MCQVLCEALETSPEHSRVPALMGCTFHQEETGGEELSTCMCMLMLVPMGYKETKAK